MNNRIYGIIGIGSYMANWNADFTNHPKSLGNGIIFGSDKALKYTIRNHMNQNGGKVMFFKSFKEEKGKLQPNDIDEKYEMLFGQKIEKNTIANEVIKNLLSADDVMNFGATYAGKQNISVLGITQIGQAINKYKDTEVHTQDILSPFRNPNEEKENDTASSLGTQTITDEAHYVYPFSVNPNAISMYKNIVPEIEYTEKHYQFFKNGALEGASLLNTASKMGCENEFALFVKIKENSNLYLPSLDSYVTVEKGNKIIYDLTEITNLLNNILKDIEEVEMYYNPVKVELRGIQGFNYLVKDIITKNII